MSHTVNWELEDIPSLILRDKTAPIEYSTSLTAATQMGHY